MKNVLTAVALATIIAQPASAQASGDAAAGVKSFGQCKACHNVDKAGPDGIGPNLYGVVGSKAASRRAKYAYSPALKGSKIVWTEAALDSWLTDPGAMVKGTKMTFVGIPRKPVRQNVIAYLKTLK